MKIRNKGNKMLKSNSISLAASLALVGSLTLVGCGSDATSETVSTNSSETQTTQKIQTGSISGTVAFINNPTDRTIRTTDATAQIVAYNLDDNTKYTTTSTSQGEYDLSALTEGSYQVIATSTSTTMRSISQASVQRDTRAVVDIVLQATGTIKGNVNILQYPYEYYGQPLISIPGTSYISTVDNKGNFELINVPAGEVTISFNGYYTQNITVVGGEESVVENLGESSNVSYVYGLNTDSTLEMGNEGIRIYMNDSYTLSEFKELVSLENNASVAADIEVDFAYDWYDEGQTTNYFKIKTTSIVDAGTYTLKVATADAYTKEIALKDKVAVFSDSYTNNGVYNKGLGIAFSNPVTDLNTSSITVTYLDDANATQILALTGIEKSTEYDNQYKLLANLDSNVEYHVTLASDIQEDGLFYVSDLGWNLSGITIGNTNIGYVSIDENEENVELTRTVRFTVQNSDSLDLQTLKVMMGTKELTLQNGGLKSAYDNYYYHNSLEIEVDTSSLSYNLDIAMSITANDSYGDEAFAKTVNFMTITPATVGVLPYVDSTNNDDDNWLYTLQDSYNGVLQAYFNVAVSHESGSITLHDNTNNKEVNVHTENSMNQPYANNTNTGYRVGGYPEELLPNTEYTMTVSGFTATDGTAIATKTNTFKTPARRLVQHNVNNGQLVDAYNMQNRLEFATFGKLSDAEKADFANGLDITSFNTAMPTDKTHPTPLVLWDDNSPYGSKLILAFTIESGTSYELAFSGDLAKELEMTASPLTFMTKSEITMASGDFTPEYNIVSNLYTYNDNQDFNLSVVSDATGYAQVTIPYIIDEGGYNSSSATACNELLYKNVYNYPIEYGYYDLETPDVNASSIVEWMSGDELNVTSTSLSGMSYNSHYVYDDNGYSVGYYYSCDVTYNANFSMNSDANSTVTVDVPQSALDASDIVADGFMANETNRTVMAPGAEEAYASVSTYSTGFSIYFSKPVSVASLEGLKFNTNPDLNRDVNTPYAPYYDADGNMYTTSFSGSLDSGAYSVFGYDVNSTVTYFDKATQTTKDLNVTRSGVVYTNADLTPLEVSDVSTMGASIYLDVNRVVDTGSVLTKDDNGTVISSAFILSNENNESNVTASIGNAYSNYNYTTNSNTLVLDVTRSDSASECYGAESFTLTQSESIKAEGSTQTLEAGSVTATIDLAAETIGCLVDDNTTVPTDSNTTI